MIRVIGIGPGAEGYVTPVALEKIEQAEIVVGSRRALESIASHARETIELPSDYKEAVRFLFENKEKDVAVVVSGDPGLYSFLAVLRKEIPADWIEVVPGISSVQLFMAKLGKTWEEVRFQSLHGRPESELSKAFEGHSKICLLLDDVNNPSKIGRFLREKGYKGMAWIGSRLSYPDEKLIEIPVENLIGVKIPGRSGMLYLEIEKGIAAGSFYGIGIGPGDPELLTIKARRLIEEADVVFAPKAGKEEESFALSIATRYASKAVVEEVVFPMTSEHAVLKEHWQTAANEVCERMDRGLKVVFITIGDPMLYSTFIYLMREVAEMRPLADVGVVPGVSALSALASSAGLPLAEGKERMAVIPTPDDVSELGTYFDEFETVVLMKVGRRLPQIIEFLEARGELQNAVLGSRVGTSDERIITDLEELRNDSKAGYLSTIIVKTKCALRTPKNQGFESGEDR